MPDKNAFMVAFTAARKLAPPNSPVALALMRLELEFGGQTVYIKQPNATEWRRADVKARMAEGLPIPVIAKRLCPIYQCAKRTIERDVVRLRPKT